MMRGSSSPRPPGLPIDLGRQWPQTTALQVAFRRRDPDRFGAPPQRIEIGRTPGVIGGYRLDVLSVFIVTVGAAELLVTVVPSQPVLRGLKPGFRIAMVQESEQVQRAVTGFLVKEVMPATIAVNDKAAVVAYAPFAIRLFIASAKMLGRDLDSPAVEPRCPFSRKSMSGSGGLHAGHGCIDFFRGWDERVSEPQGFPSAMAGCHRPGTAGHR